MYELIGKFFLVGYYLLLFMLCGVGLGLAIGACMGTMVMLFDLWDWMRQGMQ